MLAREPVLPLQRLAQANVGHLGYGYLCPVQVEQANRHWTECRTKLDHPGIG